MDFELFDSKNFDAEIPYKDEYSFTAKIVLPEKGLSEKGLSEKELNITGKILHLDDLPVKKAIKIGVRLWHRPTCPDFALRGLYGSLPEDADIKAVLEQANFIRNCLIREIPLIGGILFTNENMKKASYKDGFYLTSSVERYPSHTEVLVKLWHKDIPNEYVSAYIEDDLPSDASDATIIITANKLARDNIADIPLIIAELEYDNCNRQMMLAMIGKNKIELEKALRKRRKAEAVINMHKQGKKLIYEG